MSASITFGTDTLPSRFWAKVSVDDDTSCWEWTGSLDAKGYGRFNVNGSGGAAYRFAYRMLVGQVPEGRQLDHLCRNRACVNPAHLEPVTPLENTRRGRNHNSEKTHCKRGHELSEENVCLSNGRRHCLVCQRIAKRARRAGLTRRMRDLLWTVAQHKYGWTHVSRHRGELQVADGLVRRGLAYWAEDHHGRDGHHPQIVATRVGKDEIARLFPVSPFALGTYEHQSGGWTPCEGVAA